MNISKMKSNTIKKIIFSSVVILLLVIFNIFAFITTNNQTEKIVEIKKEIVTESTNTISLSDTKRKIEELKKIESRLDNILIDEGKIVNFISMIEELSNDLDVDIKINDVDFENNDDEELGELTMDFQISGYWNQVTNFLNSVEVVPYVVNIESLRLSTVVQSKEIIWNANFTLKGITN